MPKIHEDSLYLSIENKLELEKNKVPPVTGTLHTNGPPSLFATTQNFFIEKNM